MKNEMLKISKVHKAIILFWVFYEIIVAVSISEYDWLVNFLIWSIPCILYWSGVWIWGFGYILNFFKRFKNKKRINIKTKTKPVDKKTKRFGQLAYLSGTIVVVLINGVASVLFKETQSLFGCSLLLSLGFYIGVRIIQERCFDIGSSPNAFIVPYAIVSFFGNLFGNDVIFSSRNPLAPLYAICAIWSFICHWILLLRKGVDSPKCEHQSDNVAWVLTLIYVVLMNIVPIFIY